MEPQVAPTGAGLLDVERVGKIFGIPPRTFTALSEVSLSILPGQFVCLLGPSGCGKSTLLRIVTGLSAPTSGRVLYAGVPLSGINPHATIVFQSFALYPWLTVEQNVELPLKARGLSAAERRAKAVKLLDTVGLDGFESAYPRELSGGMRQKVGFARAMAVEPELLCLDEPFSALDVLSAEALRGELMELWHGHSMPMKAILMVTHNIEEAVMMADRILVMTRDPGRIVAEVAVTLKHPRRRKDTAFQALADDVYTLVAGGARPEPGEKRPGARRLPRARLNALAGLVETLFVEGGHADLYRLSGELQLELDDVLPIVDAAELLGLLSVEQGDLHLTALGETYADASILARKELIAGRVLRLPAISRIYDALKNDDDQRIDRSYFVERFRAEFGEKAEEELETALALGRFAELFGYDRGSNELFLEP
jgi:NitT/TauT family transport system ATP-binding protein